MAHFKVIGGAESSSTVTPHNSKAWESGTHAEVLVKIIAGIVTVTGGGLSWLLILIIIPILLLIIMNILFSLERKKKKTSAA
jgi:hypothetical protein